MKKIILAVTLAWGFSATAIAGCYVYDFAELQTYNDTELSVMALDFEGTASKMLEIMGKNMPDSRFEELSNCKVQAKRMRHIIDFRLSLPAKSIKK